MHFYLIEWATLIAIFAVAAVTPGADFALVLRQSLIYGRKNAFATSCGIGLALLFHVSYTILGLGLIIAQSLILFNIIKWLGVAYLFYIGIKAVFSRDVICVKTEKNGEQKKQQNWTKSFMAGFVVNALNPKAVFFFLSIFSTLVATTTPMPIKFCYGFSMSLLLTGWFVSVSIFMTTPFIRSIFYRVSKWINRVSGAVFIAFGVQLMFQKNS